MTSQDLRYEKKQSTKQQQGQNDHTSKAMATVLWYSGSGIAAALTFCQ